MHGSSCIDTGSRPPFFRCDELVRIMQYSPWIVLSIYVRFVCFPGTVGTRQWFLDSPDHREYMVL